MITNELCDRIRVRLPQILQGRDHVRIKADNSFVSDGDMHIQGIAETWVRERLPEYQLVSEELDSPASDWDPLKKYVVLDPIDGTENFVSGLKEWGTGISIYAYGRHQESCIFLPELGELQITGMPWRHFRSRIVGLSSSLTAHDLSTLPVMPGTEYRVMGCAMYNLLMAARGSFKMFENVKGVACWDILPGINLALEAGCQVWVDGEVYRGQLLLPVKRYKVRVEARGVFDV